MSPEEIERREFSQQMRGYNQIEVRDFLKRVAAQVSAAQNGESGSEAQGIATANPLSPEDDRFEALGDRIAGLLRTAHESAAAVKENADNEAQATVEIARDASELMRAEAAEAADAMRIAAANDAASERTAAEDEAEQIRAQARAAAETANQESERLRAEAEQFKAETEADVESFRSETEARALEFKSTTESTALEFKTATEAAAEEYKATTEAAAAEHKLLVETEMAEFKATTEAEAAELREASLNAGETELADKREETDRLLAEATADRETAMSELADARSQVTELLEQARSQSDFLRHEADEIIRGKVRTQVERAEERLQVLRNSEVASRDRIATAHAELTAAMERLDSTPAPELAHDTDVEVLEAAKARGEETNWGGALEAPAHDGAEAVAEAEIIDAEYVEADSEVVEGDVTMAEVFGAEEAPIADEADVYEAEIVDENVDSGSSETEYAETEYAETEYAETEHVETEANADVDDSVEVIEFAEGDETMASEFDHGYDVVEAEAETHDETAMPAPPTPPGGGFGAFFSGTAAAELGDHSSIESDDSELLNTFEVETPASDVSGSGLRHDDPAPAPIAPEPVGSGFDGFGEESDAASDRIPVGVGAADTENTAPENEDALARLVREAMQRAVDSARTGD